MPSLHLPYLILFILSDRLLPAESNLEELYISFLSRDLDGVVGLRLTPGHIASLFFGLCPNHAYQNPLLRTSALFRIRCVIESINQSTPGSGRIISVHIFVHSFVVR